MRRTALFLTATALVVGAANLTAQTPNFAGNWTRIADPARGPVRGAPDALAITQDSKTLTMTDLSMGDNAPTMVFNLDSTDNKQTLTIRDGTQSELISHAKWEGSKLVVATTSTVHGTSAALTLSYSLDASGNLTITVTRPSPGGGDPVTTTSSFKKS